MKPTAYLTTLLVVVSAPAITLAQDDELQDSDWRPPRDRGLRAFREGRWADAARELGAAYDALGEWDREERFAFGCELGVAQLRAEEDDAGVEAVADGLTRGDATRRASCLAMTADVYAERGAHEDAAHWYLLSLGAGDDPSVRARYERLPEGVRREAETRRAALVTQPIGAVVGTVADPDALAASLARWTRRARPTRSSGCFAVEEWARGTRGRILCSHADAPSSYGFGGRDYPLETFLWARVRGGVRVIAAYASGTGYDCESGHEVNDHTPERLTTAAHGVDGWLVRVDERWEGLRSGELGYTDTTYVYACNTRAGSCARVEESAQQCRVNDAGATHCTGYAGHASVRRGLLTIRIDRGELPASLREPIELSALSPPAPAARDERRSRARSMRGCRIEVHDRAPPLNVRARPDAHAAVVGTLEEGTAVDVVEGSHGRWIQLRGPVAGWVFARNLRRRCDPR